MIRMPIFFPTDDKVPAKIVTVKNGVELEKIDDSRCLPVNGNTCIYKGDEYRLYRNYKNTKIFYNTNLDRNGWHLIVVKKSQLNDQVIFRWPDNHAKEMIEVLENTYDLEDVPDLHGGLCEGGSK